MIGPCSQCVCVMGVWNGRRDWLLCPNYPGHEGELSHVSGTGIVVDCRKFRPRREVAALPPGTEAAVRYISLGDGSFAIVDAADYAWLSRYTWRVVGRGYASARVGDKGVLMHRLIMQPSPGKVVDHLNGNRRDNRRGNLRVCTQGENLRNTRKSRGTSRFKGVSRSRELGKWRATIRHNGKTIHLGRFDDEIEAAKAYDRAAREYFGAFACLNFPHLGQIVCLSGRITIHSHGRGRVHVLKSETNPKDQSPKLETKPRARRLFRSLNHLDFGHCVEPRISYFEIPLCVMSTGPPAVGHRSLTTSYDSTIGKLRLPLPPV